MWRVIGLPSLVGLVGLVGVAGAGCREPSRGEVITPAPARLVDAGTIDAGSPGSATERGTTGSAPARASSPATLEAGLAALRAARLDAAADTIARRVRQRAPKLKLTAEQGRDAAGALLEHGHRDSIRALHAVMPRSTVELARAVRERGVPIDEAERIARYLVEVVRALDFERLATFDENHAHVTGRDWPEIDYTGEGMTWQSQRAHWQPRGVTDFRTAASIHAYFVGAERLPHWRRVYRPRGKMSGVRIEP